MKALRGTALKRFVRAQERPPLSLVLVLEDVEDPVNVGSIFRVADALKVDALVLCGITARPPHKLITKVGRNKDKRVAWRHESAVETALDELAADGYTRIAVELTDASALYTEVDYPERTALVVGHEDHGVTKKALAKVDRAVYLPMFGKGGSLNVHVAASICAYEVVRSRRAQMLSAADPDSR